MNKHAIVIGASMAGLFAARVLANHFTQVTVLERDVPHSGPAPRKGVPQGNHVHVLLKSGEQVLEALFPGIIKDLGANGSKQIDTSADFCWLHHHHWKLRFDSGLTTITQTRPLLEWHIRQRLMDYTNITFCYQTVVQELLTNADKSRIVGLKTQQQGEAVEYYADLIVDAGGRASKMPQWYESLGYQKPVEETVKINLGYASRMYERPADESSDWSAMILYPKMPELKAAGYIFDVEEDRWIVTLAGYMGNHPPHDDEGFLKFAEELAHPDLYRLIKKSKPLSDIKVFKYPQERRYRYDKLPNYPTGLIAIGDAFCSFDPVFGQGMSVAAKEAIVLDKCLQQAQQAGIIHTPQFCKTYFKQVYKATTLPWLLATSEGLRYVLEGQKRPPHLQFLHWYNGKVFELSGSNPAVAKTFLQVMHLLKGPEVLFKPAVLGAVIKHSLQSNYQQPDIQPLPTKLSTTELAPYQNGNQQLYPWLAVAGLAATALVARRYFGARRG